MGTGEAQPRAAELAVGRRWTFGPAVLDERSLELTVNGTLERLERKPLEVLLYLLHHAGEVVTKEDLAENLWPGRILTETVLTRCISLLRQALGDADKSMVRTVHGFGYRLVADVRVEAAVSAVAAPVLDFKPGDRPPLRPHWRLVERLGTGGHGEAWLAEQEKTRDHRVFKFAVDAGGLAALKREITLYRLLNDTLGDGAPVVRLLEWNLEEAPYFIETEYIEGRDLHAWSEANGGLPSMALERRLDLVAQIAEGVAKAHSVGALHKDLKPSNVLVHGGDKPLIKLCDFGSGGVLDAVRLEKLGITRLGFTKTSADATNATPLYVSPEVIAGQPSTVVGDIYALGVILYQVVVGDLRKALAPGWELDVPDELLREDIGAAAAGDPSRRLADAAQLAERLRTLDSRRLARAAEAAARERAERVRKVQEELRRTRAYAAVLLGATAIAVAGGVIAYKARNDAHAATATAESVSDFLIEDVLRLDSGVLKPSETSYESLLNRAGAEVTVRLKEQPEAAAKIHWLLGRRYQEIGQFKVATQHYERAVALFTQLRGRSADQTLMALDRLSWAYAETGRFAEALSVAQEIRALWQTRLPTADLAMLLVRVRIARTLLTAGRHTEAERELREVIRLSSGARALFDSKALFQDWFGISLPYPESAPELLSALANYYLAANVLEERSDGYAEPESRLRQSLEVFSKVLGEDNELVAITHMGLAVLLALAGNYVDAEHSAVRSQNIFDNLLPPRHFARAIPKAALGRVRFEQRRFSEALLLFQEALTLCTEHRGCPTRAHSEFLWDVGRTYDELGRTTTAIDTLRSALSLQEALAGSNHPYAFRCRLSLADALRKAGKVAEAFEVLASSSGAIADLSPYQQTTADLRRVEGLLFLQMRDYDKARSALTEALKITTRRQGARHWRNDRALAELSRVPPSTRHQAGS